METARVARPFRLLRTLADALCAGDTMGDEPMLRSGLPCVIVGNATEELTEAMHSCTHSGGQPGLH